MAQTALVFGRIRAFDNFPGGGYQPAAKFHKLIRVGPHPHALPSLTLRILTHSVGAWSACPGGDASDSETRSSAIPVSVFDNR
jgi:hypothetical protein